MERLIRLLLAVVAVCAAGLALAASPAQATGQVVDGVELHYLPPGLGGSTDFAYEFEHVTFAARVWESGSDAAGWRVDLDEQVMRGARLTSARRLHDWFIAYEERRPAEAHYSAVLVRGKRGWVCRDQVFWLARPGMAVSVLLDRHRWSRHDVLRIARSARVRAG
jgi:hypothetical protein